MWIAAHIASNNCWVSGSDFVWSCHSEESKWFWNHYSLATENQTRSHPFFILRWHRCSVSFWSSQELMWQSVMIRGRCEMVQRARAIGVCDDPSKTEERTVQQGGQNFGVVQMVMRVRNDEGFWEDFCHLFLKNSIKAKRHKNVVLLPNFLLIIMVLRNNSLCHSNLTAFFSHISMCSMYFFSFCSSHKSSQCKHSQGHFATVQQWQLLSIHLWSRHQITKWIDTVCSFFYHVEIFLFKWHEVLHISLSTFHIQ